MDITGKPEASTIVEYRRHLEGTWSMSHAHWTQVVDPWYWRYANIWPADVARASYIPSTARNIVDHAADTHMAFEPKFSRKPVGKGKRHEEDADAVEAGLHAVFIDAMLQETSLAFYQLGKYLGMYGYAIAEGPLLDFEDRPEPPVKRRGETDQEFRWREIDYANAKRYWNPIRIRAPHPRQVLLDPHRKQPREGIKFTRLTVSRIKHLLESMKERERKPEFVENIDKLALPQNSPMEDVEVTEYWSTEYHAMTVGHALAFVERNLYGFVPFNHAFSGFGQEAANDLKGDPFYLAQGLLDPLLDNGHASGSLKVQAQSYSAKHTAVIERAYLKYRVPPGQEEEMAQQLEKDIVGADKDDIGFIIYPEIERGLYQIDQQVGEDIEMGTFSRSVGGMRQKGVSTVGQQAILTTADNRKFASTHKQINLMGTVIGMNILRLVDRLEEPISAGGVTLSPKQIHNDYNIIAEFPVLDPIIQLQEREMGLREKQEGLISAETYRENALRVANESVEKKRLIKERVRELPAYFQAIATQIAQEDGMEDILENMDGEPILGPDGQPMPQISDQAGGGATRSMRQALTGDTMNPPRFEAAAQ